MTTKPTSLYMGKYYGEAVEWPGLNQLDIALDRAARANDVNAVQRFLIHLSTRQERPSEYQHPLTILRSIKKTIQTISAEERTDRFEQILVLLQQSEQKISQRMQQQSDAEFSSLLRINNDAP